jgi:iron complex transport system substrate-binding protein
VNRSVRINVVLLVLALGAFACVVLVMAPRPHANARAQSAHITTVEDATGATLPVRRYMRIASGSLIADRLLLELVEPERLIAFSPYTTEDSPIAHLFGNKPRMDARGDVERVVSLRPDLMVVNEIVDPARIAPLRRSGLTVADLGPMRGVRTLRKNITLLATLVDEPARGRALLARFDRRVRLLASRPIPGRKVRGMYLGIHGNRIYGGASGTSFHDVITMAGLEDAAAQYREWPSFSSEQVLAMDPDVIVTQRGRTDAVCRHAGFEVLRACIEHRIIELPEALINDPGLSMIDAAEVLHEAAYGAAR